MLLSLSIFYPFAEASMLGLVSLSGQESTSRSSRFVPMNPVAADVRRRISRPVHFPPPYSPDGRIEYSLLQRFWLVARREEGSIAAALFDPTSNNATSQKRCNPWGKGRFVLRLRCLLGRGSLRIHSLARASPQAKPPLCKLYSILPSGE